LFINIRYCYKYYYTTNLKFVKENSPYKTKIVKTIVAKANAFVQYDNYKVQYFDFARKYLQFIQL